MSKMDGVTQSMPLNSWRDFNLNLKISGEEKSLDRLDMLKETYNMLQDRVTQLRAKKMFLSAVSNSTTEDPNGAFLSKQQRLKIDKENAFSGRLKEDAVNRMDSNTVAVKSAIAALRTAIEDADRMDMDLETRARDLESTKALKQNLEREVIVQEQNYEIAKTPQDSRDEEVLQFIEKISQCRVARIQNGVVDLELLDLPEPYTLSLQFKQCGRSQQLCGAEMSPEGVELHDLIDFCVRMNDAPFLVSEARQRAMCLSKRQKEVKMLAQKFFLHDEKSRILITFQSGVIGTIETGPDYPVNSNAIKLVSLETMGVFPDRVESLEPMMKQCSTLTEMVEFLGGKFNRAPKNLSGVLRSFPNNN